LACTKEYFEKDTSTELFLATDVYDVVFQGNPFTKHDVLNYDLFLTEEGVEVHEEPWNFQNIGSLFPKYLDGCLKQNVVCSGIICGKRNAMIKLYGDMIDYCENKATENHNIKDQAALIVLLSQGLVEKAKRYNLNDAWVVNCAVAGPTQFFDGWGFRGKLTAKNLRIPTMEADNAVKTGDIKYDIVHQFNRISDWNNTLTSPWKYE
jgi:hypothetical protein